MRGIATPGGAIKNQNQGPKIGTLAWVKWDSEQRKKQDGYNQQLEVGNARRNNHRFSRNRKARTY